MKTLFTTDGKQDYTDEAMILDREFRKALEPIILRAKSKGYFLIDVSYVATATLADLIVMNRLED